MNALAYLVGGLLRIVRAPAVWSARVEMRAQLAALPEHLLADLGLDPAAVAREARRPFWRPFGACLATVPSLRQGAPSSAPLPVPAVLRPVTRLPGATFPSLS